MPDELKEQLVARGYRSIDIGDLCLDLETGRKTRRIELDGHDLGEAVFPSAEIDWRRHRDYPVGLDFLTHST